MVDIGEQFRQISENLLNLEINTIVKDTILGEKMASADLALLDVIEWYDATLCDLGALRIEPHDAFAGPAAYTRVRNRAQARIDQLGSLAGRRADTLMLYRIRDKSDQLLALFSAFARRVGKPYPDDLSRAALQEKPSAYRFPPNDLILIRKVWEIGTEEIVLQTVVQLDGDVITRMKPGQSEADARRILELHQQAVKTSISFWHDLVDLVVELVGNAGKLFFH